MSIVNALLSGVNYPNNWINTIDQIELDVITSDESAYTTISTYPLPTWNTGPGTPENPVTEDVNGNALSASVIAANLQYSINSAAVTIHEGSVDVTNENQVSDLTITDSISGTDLTIKIVGTFLKTAFPNMVYKYQGLRGVTQAEVDAGNVMKAPGMKEVATNPTIYASSDDLAFNEETIKDVIVCGVSDNGYGKWNVISNGNWIYRKLDDAPASVDLEDSFTVTTEEGTERKITVKVNEELVQRGMLYTLDPKTLEKATGTAAIVKYGDYTFDITTLTYDKNNIVSDWPPTNPDAKHINSMVTDVRHDKTITIKVVYAFDDHYNANTHNVTIDYDITLMNTTANSYMTDIQTFMES
jgi:VCBS repeat-containing protein